MLVGYLHHTKLDLEVKSSKQLKITIPNSGLSAEMPASEEKISGAPLPRAIMVTPATFCDNLNK